MKLGFQRRKQNSHSMDAQSKKKPKVDGEDRISALPDELLHQILKFLDTKSAFQTTILSKRWKLVWTTLPFLKFIWDFPDKQNTSNNKSIGKFTHHVLYHRNRHSSISHLELKFLTPGLLDRFIKYAISHNVEVLDVHFRFKHKPYNLSNFTSSSIKKLKVRMNFERIVSESDCWDLPALTSLHLRGLFWAYEPETLPEICITCLPALRSLCLEDWDFKDLVNGRSSVSFDWPALTSFSLIKCKLPTKVWNMPYVKSLELHKVTFPENMNDIFAALVSLQSLILSFKEVSHNGLFLTCPELVNLEIRTCCGDKFYKNLERNIVVLAPKLRYFTSVGIFTVKFEVPELGYVNIKLRGWIDDQEFSPNKLRQYHREFKQMLPGLGGAKILNLELETMKALLSISPFLVSSPSPFYNLKYVKLPHGCEEASIPSNLRSYLLGASPTATIVTTFSQNMNSPTTSVTSQNVVPQKPLVSSTKVLVNSGYESVPIDTVDMGVQVEHVVQNFVEYASSDRVRHVGSSVEGTDNGHVSSSSGNIDSGLWRGYAVNSEFVILLNAIMDKYPETFEHFTTKNKKFGTMKLNMFCTSINDFAKISMIKVNTQMITEYRDVFADLEKLGFNVSWLVSRLNFIEQLRISQPLLPELHAIDGDINDANSKLQDLQIDMDKMKTKLQNLKTLREKKMQDIQELFGTMGRNLAVGYVGDDLLPGSLFT